MSRDQIGNTDVTGLLYVSSEFMRNHLIAVVGLGDVWFEILLSELREEVLSVAYTVHSLKYHLLFCSENSGSLMQAYLWFPESEGVYWEAERPGRRPVCVWEANILSV